MDDIEENLSILQYFYSLSHLTLFFIPANEINSISTQIQVLFFGFFLVSLLSFVLTEMISWFEYFFIFSYFNRYLSCQFCMQNMEMKMSREL